MAKYKVSVGAFITHFAHGTYTVSAKDAAEAVEKAKDRFSKRQMSAARNTDVGTIQVDDVREET